ncbi:unnamed protein product [Ixodes persulcatus]
MARGPWRHHSPDTCFHRCQKITFNTKGRITGTLAFIFKIPILLHCKYTIKSVAMTCPSHQVSLPIFLQSLIYSLYINALISRSRGPNFTNQLLQQFCNIL